MIKNRKFTLLQGAAILMIGGLMIVGVTLAILEADLGSKVNTFSSKNAKVNVAVVENNSGDKYETNDGLILDNISTDLEKPSKKSVSILNYDRSDYPTTNTYVRVRLIPSFVYNTGHHHEGETVAIDLTDTVHYNLSASKNWTAQVIEGETYYFYKNAIAPDAITDELLESVYYSGEIPADSHFELQVLVDGISADGSDDSKYASAVEAWELNSYLSDNQINGLFTNTVEKE